MKKWIVIDLLLLVVAGWLGWQLYDSIRRFKEANDLAKIRPVQQNMKPQKTAQEKILPQLPAAKIYSAAEFAMIPEKNIFSESRSKEEKVDPLAKPEPPPLTQKPVLVGVAIIDNQRTVSIIDPLSPPQGQSRRAQVKRIGDVYQGYAITSIEPDYFVLESGTRREIIPLRAGSKRPHGGKTPILATRIVPVGPGGISGGNIVSIISGGNVLRTPQAPLQIPITTPITPAASASSAPSANRSTAAQTRQTQQSAPQQQPRTWNERTNDQGIQVIHTPFGDIPQPNPR